MDSGLSTAGSESAADIQTIENQQQITDGLLIHLVTTQMDAKSHIKWEEGLPINDLLTWDSMTPF